MKKIRAIPPLTLNLIVGKTLSRGRGPSSCGRNVESTSTERTQFYTVDNRKSLRKSHHTPFNKWSMIGHKLQQLRSDLEEYEQFEQEGLDVGEQIILVKKQLSYWEEELTGKITQRKEN